MRTVRYKQTSQKNKVKQSARGRFTDVKPGKDGVLVDWLAVVAVPTFEAQSSSEKWAPKNKGSKNEGYKNEGSKNDGS